MNKFAFTLAAFSLVAGILIGTAISRQFSPTPSAAADSSVDGAWKQKLQNLTDHEIAEYYQLKTLEERYKKADEILGKIVLIFLADLGLRSDKVSVDQVKSNALRIDNSKPAVSSEPLAVAPSEKPPMAPPPPASASNAWQAAEKFRNELRSERDFSDFLAKVRIDDLAGQLSSMRKFSNATNELSHLKGRFTGSAQVPEPDRTRTWDVEITLRAEMIDGKLTGFARTLMSENGKVFSNSRDRGEVNSYREFSTGSAAVMIRSSPTTYLQTYYLPDQDSLIGNIYKRNDEAEPFKNIGTMILRRAR